MSSFNSLTYDPRHEHLYEIIRGNVIESGNFKRSIVENERLLLGSRVILCTISMLSTNRLMELGFTKLVPVQTVIIDEASQIEAGDYLPMLALYKTTLRKMVFIGDDKQCKCGGRGQMRFFRADSGFAVAPYGQEDIWELKSVFEWPHLKENAVFLDTQCMLLSPPKSSTVLITPRQTECRQSSETSSPAASTPPNSEQYT